MDDYVKLVISVFAIGMGCCIPIVAIYLDYRKRRDTLTLYHQERMAAIEKGIELPPTPETFFREDSDGGKSRSPHSDFGWGLFWLLGGLATFAALYFNSRESGALYALIPVAIGLHYLIYYYVVGKKEAAAREALRGAQAGRTDPGPRE